MTKEKLLRLLMLISCIAMLIIALAQSYQMVNSYFTHIDDVGVAKSLTHDNFNQRCPERFKALNVSSASMVCTILKLPYRATLIPKLWTYAPAQFWITAFLMPENNSFTYEQIKYRGRIVSFASFFLGLIAFFFLLYNKLPQYKNNIIPSVTATLFLALSLEARIMSAQMHSYAITILSISFALYTIITLYEDKKNSCIRYVTYGAIFGICLSMQYQVLPLLLSGFLTIFLFKDRNFAFIKNFAICFIIFLITSALSGSFYLIKHSQKGINWNAGVNNEYIVNDENIFTRFYTLIKLIFTESPDVFYSVISGIEIFKPFDTLFGIISFIIFLIGFYLCIKKLNNNRFIVTILIIYILINLVLIYFSKISYSPTRHSLIYLPGIIIISGYTIIYLYNKFPKGPIFFLLTMALTCYPLLSLIKFENFYKHRIDPISSVKFNDIVNKYRPEFFVLDTGAVEPFFFRNINPGISFLDLTDDPTLLCEKYLLLNNVKTFIWYSKRRDFDNSEVYLQERLKLISTKCNLPNEEFSSKIFKVLADINIIRSDKEIDLSNKTSNGSNEIFIQQIQTMAPLLLPPKN